MTPICKYCGSEAIWHNRYSALGHDVGEYRCSLCDCEVYEQAHIDYNFDEAFFNTNIAIRILY